jgi:hypothetical protein
MTTTTNLKGGAWRRTHNETLVRDEHAVQLRVKTKLRAGINKYNDIVFKRG